MSQTYAKCPAYLTSVFISQLIKQTFQRACTYKTMAIQLFKFKIMSYCLKIQENKEY